MVNMADVENIANTYSSPNSNAEAIHALGGGWGYMQVDEDLSDYSSDNFYERMHAVVEDRTLPPYQRHHHREDYYVRHTIFHVSTNEPAPPNETDAQRQEREGRNAEKAQCHILE